MKSSWLVVVALILGACSGAPSTTQSVFARALFNDTTIGGANYPVVISGADNTGVSAQQIAQNLRFPARLRADSSFKAVSANPALVNHAHLDIGANGASTLKFLHGDRTIGLGDISLPLQAYGDPTALGSASATLIKTMLQEADQNTRSDRRRISF